MGKSANLVLDCPMSVAINILSGKWKLAILWHLKKGVIRFNEFQKLLPDITHKTLTMQLRELESDSIIYRNVYPEVPPRVEYELTEVGKSLIPILDSMCEWGRYYQGRNN